jgi:Na+-translocating ferredoxin:NAD+ oxidoreductase RnfG subunit
MSYLAIAAIVSGVLTAASSAASQKQAADAQERQQKIAAQQERQRYLEEVTSLRSQEAQEQVARSQRLQEAEVKGKEAKASAVVAAGEGGVAGLSVEALVANISRKEATYAFSEKKQAEMIGIGRTLELQSAGSGYQRNLLTINRPIQQPNYLNAALEGTQAGLGIYSAGQKAGLTTPKAK